MTSMQIFALAWLVLIFALSLWREINLGLALIPAAFVLAEIAGVSGKQLYAGFPTQLIILILGVMYLWNQIHESGLADLFVGRTVALVHGRVYLLPWAMCLLTALICAAGAFPAAVLAITIPVGLEIAKRERILNALMGIVTIQGAIIGGFSPLNPWANVVATVAERANIHFLGGCFFLFQAILAAVIALAGFFCFGGAELLRRRSPRRSPAPPPTASPSAPSPFTPYQLASLAALGAFVVLVLLKLDIGLTAFGLGVLLQIMFRGGGSQKAIAKLPWGIAMMIAGVLLYVGLLESLGVLRTIGYLLESVQRPALVRVGISYLGTIIANFESATVGVLGLVLPVAIKSMGSGSSALVVNLRLALLSGSIAVMAASPFHIGGALVLAGSDRGERTFKDLLIWVVCLAAILPLLAFLI
ncbi:MAG: SLC13 family permease [Desulfobaccales bacterium]